MVALLGCAHVPVSTGKYWSLNAAGRGSQGIMGPTWQMRRKHGALIGSLSVELAMMVDATLAWLAGWICEMMCVSFPFVFNEEVLVGNKIFVFFVLFCFVFLSSSSLPLYTCGSFTYEAGLLVFFYCKIPQ